MNFTKIIYKHIHIIRRSQKQKPRSQSTKHWNMNLQQVNLKYVYGIPYTVYIIPSESK